MAHILHTYIELSRTGGAARHLAAGRCMYVRARIKHAALIAPVISGCASHLYGKSLIECLDDAFVNVSNVKRPVISRGSESCPRTVLSLFLSLRLVTRKMAILLSNYIHAIVKQLSRANIKRILSGGEKQN